MVLADVDYVVHEEYCSKMHKYENGESLTGEQTWPSLHLSALHMPLRPHRVAAFSNSLLKSIQKVTAESYIVTVDSGSGAWPIFRR